MGNKAVKARREAAEIRKVLWRALIAFTIGIVLAVLAFQYIGDKFFSDMCSTSLGRLPAYVFMGTFAGGLYMVIQYIGEMVYNGKKSNMPVRFTFTSFYAVLLFIAPVAFIGLVIYRFYQLAKLRKIELEDTEGN